MMKLQPLALLTLACLSTNAHADLSYKQKSTYSKLVPNFSSGLSKVSIKNDVTRVDINFFGSPLIMLTQPNGTFTQIDPTAKVYTVSTGENDKSDPKNPKGTPLSVVSTVKKMGMEKVNGVSAQRWRVELVMPSAPTPPSETVKMTLDLWSGTTPSPLSPKTQDLAINDVPVNIRAMVGGNIKVKGDVKGMRSAYANVPLRLRTTVNGMFLATTVTSEISTKPLPASLFSVPKGYRKISFTEWTKVINDTIANKMS